MKGILAAFAALPLLAGEPVTFHRHIAPLIFQYCSPCHRPGEAAPFPLLTYEDVRRRASQIVAVTQRRYMPPWLPEPGFGDFAGARRLSDDQLSVIAEWVRQGTSEGPPGNARPPRFTEGWQIGPPDLVVRMSVPYRLAADGGDVFRNFILPVNLKETRHVRAIELRPGNKRLVHHANIWIDRRQTLRRRDGEDGQPGFFGMENVSTEARSDSFDPDTHFLFWKPGTVVEPAPADMSWRLDPGTDLILNVHLQPSGKEETIQAVLGLYFTSEPPRRFPMLVQLEHDGAINIPAGTREFAVTDQLILPGAVDVLAIYPHAHYLGKQIEAWATLPDGTRRWLIRINDWDINWQAVYTYRQPVSLPKGATLAMRITYDNSAGNPRNPNHPPKQVRAGPRGEDEMGHVWLQVLPERESGRATLQEAIMRRRLEKYPGDFVAHCNLGALLAIREQYGESALHFEQALRAQPSSATAHNGLGADLLAQDRVPDAVRELREALRLDPLHFNARWNLAKALIRQGDSNGAAAELETCLKQKPDNADVQAGLGMIYFLQQRYDDALPRFQAAVRLKPEDGDIRTNLGALLASRGDLPGAIQAFEQALKLNPHDAVARNHLARARSQSASKDDYARGLELQQRGDLQGARSAYEAALKSSPGRVDALSNLGLVYGQLGEYERAIRTFHKALAIAPGQPVVRFNLALTFLQAEQFENARSELAAIVASQPENPAARHMLGLSLLKLGRTADGIAELEIARRARPNDMDLACTLASAYIKMRQPGPAKELVENVLSHSDTAQAHFITGSYYMAVHDYRQSLEQLRRAHELNANLPDLGTALADAYALTGSQDLAVQMFEKELRANPLDYTANAFLGWLYLEAQQADQAATYLNRAHQIKPNDTDLLFQLARLARLKGDQQKAAELLERVIADKPDYAPAHVLLAQTYIRLKRLEDAARERAIVNRLNAQEQRPQ